jgi:hypothetical protein
MYFVYSTPEKTNTSFLLSSVIYTNFFFLKKNTDGFAVIENGYVLTENEGNFLFLHFASVTVVPIMENVTYVGAVFISSRVHNGSRRSGFSTL